MASSFLLRNLRPSPPPLEPIKLTPTPAEPGSLPATLFPRDLLQEKPGPVVGDIIRDINNAAHNESYYQPQWEEIAKLSDDERFEISHAVNDLTSDPEKSQPGVFDMLSKAKAANGPLDFSQPIFIEGKNQRMSGVGRGIQRTIGRPVAPIRRGVQAVAEKHIRFPGKVAGGILGDALTLGTASPAWKEAGGQFAVDTAKSLVSPAGLLTAPISEGRTVGGVGLRALAKVPGVAGLLRKAGELISSVPTPKSENIPWLGQDWVRQRGGTPALKMVDVFDPWKRVDPEFAEVLRATRAQGAPDNQKIADLLLRQLNLTPQRRKIVDTLIEQGTFKFPNAGEAAKVGGPLLDSAKRIKAVFGKEVIDDDALVLAKDISHFQETIGEDAARLFPDSAARVRITNNLGKRARGRVYKEFEDEANNLAPMTEEALRRAGGVTQAGLASGLKRAKVAPEHLTLIDPAAAFAISAKRQAAATNQLHAFEEMAKMPKVFLEKPTGKGFGEQLALRSAEAKAVGWVQIPDLPNKFGKIAGGWMEPYHAELAMGLTRSINRAHPYTTKMKQILVPLSVRARFNNWVGNILMNTADDMSFFKLPFLMKRARDDFKTKGPAYQALLREGRLRSSGEIEGMDEFLDSIQNIGNEYAKTNKPFDPVEFALDLTEATMPKKGAFGLRGGILKAATDSYQKSEVLAKIVKTIDRLDKGDTAREATDRAAKWLYDYGDLSDNLKLLRQGPIPFATYPIKTIPRMIELAANKPFVFSMWSNAIAALNNQQLGSQGLDMKEIEAYRREAEDLAVEYYGSFLGDTLSRFFAELYLPHVIGAITIGDKKAAVLSNALPSLPVGSLAPGRGLTVPLGLVGSAALDIFKANAKKNALSARNPDVAPEMAEEQTTQAGMGMYLPLLRAATPLLGSPGAALGSPTTTTALRYLLSRAGESEDPGRAEAARTIQGNIWPRDIKRYEPSVPSVYRSTAAVLGTPELAIGQEAQIGSIFSLIDTPRQRLSWMKNRAQRGMTANLRDITATGKHLIMGSKMVDTRDGGE